MEFFSACQRYDVVRHDCRISGGERKQRVVVHSHNHQSIQSMGDIGATLLDELEAFFVSTTKQLQEEMLKEVKESQAPGGGKKTIKAIKTGLRDIEKVRLSSAFNQLLWRTEA